MDIDRDSIDRGSLDRSVASGEYIFTLSVSGVSDIAELTDRALPLHISGVGQVSDYPVFDRAFAYGLSGVGSLSILKDRALLLGINGVGSPALLTDRAIPLDLRASGQASVPVFDWYFSLLFDGESDLSISALDRLVDLSLGGSGGFLYTGCTPSYPQGGLMLMDRGDMDRGTGVTGLRHNCIPPILVDRTIIMGLSGSGSCLCDFCKLWDLALSGSGEISTPIFDWAFAMALSGTGSASIIRDRTLLLSLLATGRFTSEEWTRYIDLLFAGTGLVSTPVPFIPVHYLISAIRGTGKMWSPHLLREITNISDLIISSSVHASLSDKMMTAKVTFDSNEQAGPYSSMFWSKVTLFQPDYTGGFHPTFVGFFPTASQKFTDAGAEEETITAYSYEWYLSHQFLEAYTDGDGVPHNQLTLLTPADQQQQKIHNLAFDYPTPGFRVGDWVIGNTTGHVGYVIQINAGGLSNHIRLMYMVPSGLSYYFQNDEPLYVGSTLRAYADGHSINETGTITTMYPEDYIEDLLGGADWAKVTGIYPYRMANITAAWTLMPATRFEFTSKTTKAKAIEEVCKYCKALFYMRWRTDITGYVGAYTPCAYTIKESDIDDPSNGIDLPAPAVMTLEGSYSDADLGRFLLGEITCEVKGDEQINWVVLRCQDINGVWLESHKSASITYDSDVYDPTYNPTGTEKKCSYYEERSDILTQASLDSMADDIYAYYKYNIRTFRIQILERPDLRLLQLMQVSGFTTWMPDGTYRIIDITYEQSDEENYISLRVINNDQFYSFLNIKRIFYDAVYEVQAIVDDMLANKVGSVTGVAVAVTGAGEVKFTTQLVGLVTSYLSGYDPTLAITSGDKILAIPDSKGQYICVKL